MTVDTEEKPEEQQKEPEMAAESTENVSRETLGGLGKQPVKLIGEPWRIDGELDATENVAIYRFENGVRGVVVVTPYKAGVNYVRFYRLIGEPVGLLKEYFDNWEVIND